MDKILKPGSDRPADQGRHDEQPDLMQRCATYDQGGPEAACATWPPL